MLYMKLCFGVSKNQGSLHLHFRKLIRILVWKCTLLFIFHLKMLLIFTSIPALTNGHVVQFFPHLAIPFWFLVWYLFGAKNTQRLNIVQLYITWFCYICVASVKCQTWNLSLTHGHCPCKILPAWGKIELWTYAICCKFSSQCYFEVFFSLWFWFNKAKME